MRWTLLRNRKLPNLSRYVSAMSQRSQKGSAENAAGCLFSLLSTGAAWLFLERFIGPVAAGFVSVLLVLPIITSLVMLWASAMAKPKNAAEQQRKEAYEAILFMNGALARGHLHRKIDPATGLLLEECARHWGRVQDALSGPFWEDKNIPTHWKSVRDGSLAAADRAMDDIIVMLKPVLEARNPQGSAQEIIGDVLEAFFNVDLQAPIEPLPAAFLPARDIANKLKSLADEVEAASQKAVREQGFAGPYSSPTEIDQVLSNLREIRQAETELQQEVRSEE